MIIRGFEIKSKVPKNLFQINHAVKGELRTCMRRHSGVQRVLESFLNTCRIGVYMSAAYNPFMNPNYRTRQDRKDYPGVKKTAHNRGLQRDRPCRLPSLARSY